MDHNKPTPTRGIFLLSDPFLPDPNFRRSVVLLTEHNDEGTIGFVLNQQSELHLKDVVQNFPPFAAPLFIGGPVHQDSLHFIHRIDELREDESEIASGVYWGGDFDKLRFLIDSNQINENDIRFFLGYSGWAPQQLEEELSSNSWIVFPAKQQFTFFHNPENLWKEILRSKGDKYRMISNYPLDPGDN